MLEKQHQNFEVAMRKWEILAAVEKKKEKHMNAYDISAIKRVARNFLENSLHIVVVKNSGKEMYKKSVLRVQSWLLLIRPIVVFSP